MKYLEQLTKLGFSDKEIKIYTTLLKNGRLTPAAISRSTKINRATVYNTAKSLASKGVVSEDLGGKSLYFIALPPTRLKQILVKQKQDLRDKELLVDRLIQDLSLINSTGNYPVPKIRFIEEGRLEEYLYDEASKWHKSAEQIDNTWWGFQDNQLIEQYQKWLHWLWATVHKDSTVKMFSNGSSLELKLKNKYPKRQVKLVSPSKFTATTWVVGEYLIMIASQNHPYYLVEIHDIALSHNMREVFRNLWDKS